MLLAVSHMMEAHKIPADEELWRLMLAGDEDAFTTLYRRRQGGIYRFALQMSGSTAIAEDVTQEVFMALVRDSQKFDPTRGTLAAYLYGIARHHVLRCLHKDRAHVPLGEEHAAADAPPGVQLAAPGDILGDLARTELIERIRQVVLALPAHYREVVVLCELHEMSYVEAAAVLGCAVGTVRSRLHRARGMLVDKLRAARAMDSSSSPSSSRSPRGVDSQRCFA